MVTRFLTAAAVLPSFMEGVRKVFAVWTSITSPSLWRNVNIDTETQWKMEEEGAGTVGGGWGRCGGDGDEEGGIEQ